MILDSIPETLLAFTLEFSSLEDRMKVFMLNSAFKAMKKELDMVLRRVQISNPLQSSILNSNLLNWKHLVDIDMSSYATDEIIMQLPSTISRVKMVGSKSVTDSGLHAWCHNDNPCRPSFLEYIDLTFCSGTSYAGTFTLREAYPAIIIRRQPEWMDGHFVTPFDNDGLHTYWCDGSFQFEREQQSCGHVSELFLYPGSNGDHVGDKLQYTNFIPPEGWPEWSRFCYRPGVSLLRIDNDGSEKNVLVGQCLFGIRPPEDYPKKEHFHLVPLHSSRYFDRNGKLLGEGHDTGERYVMVSRMKVLPLEQVMPPSHVVEQNKVYLESVPLDLSLQRGEEFLHHALNRL
jgi:hypothetical protein